MNKDAENSFYLYVTSNQETGVISKKNINIVQIHKKLEFLLGTQLANDIYIYIYICVYQNILLKSNEYYFIIHTLTSKESVYKRPTQY